VAQVGRISGPLLQENLIRNGIDLAFRNDLSTTELLYLDVNNDKISVNKNSPTAELDVDGTLGATNLLTDATSTTINNLTFTNNRIDIFNTAVDDKIYLDAQEAIVVNNLQTEQFYIYDNKITTKDSNANIDLFANGTGTVEILSNLNVDGNLHATGNLTFDGNITFGDTLSQDTVTFSADIDSDIIPDQTGVFNLGQNGKRWGEMHVNLVNGELIDVSEYNAGGVYISFRPGNIFYVAQNGDDTNVGDTQQGPFRTIKHALDVADASVSGPVTIYVYPGEYQEQTPLVVPTNVTVVGADMRNTVIMPDSANQSEDIFHLNGETTIQNLTLKDFFYDSINDKGYGFRFAPNTTVSTRSPYIQNCTVITQGSSTPTEDPRGFSQADAGKGALVDGADVTGASQEASMLFHSCTFITPGVDALTMTNGVRVEWLNCFTYFADRGLYAVDGATGHLSTDGSTILYGAELRSIGSANIYGNYGAVADGSNTLMYLIQHNMAYIGAGKFVDNDPSRSVESQQTVELNSGRIRYQVTDHNGKYSVGDNFYIDFETGETSVDISSLTANGITGIIITDPVSGRVTRVTPTNIETGNLQFFANRLESKSGDVIVRSYTNTINLNKNTNITDNLSISGNLSFDGSLNVLGNEATDTLSLNVDIDQDFNPHETLIYSLGTDTKRWKKIFTSQVNADGITFFDNVVTTNDTNASLELRASGTGNVYVPANNILVTNDFDVLQTSNLTNVSIIGDLSTSGHINLASNFTTENAILQQGLIVGASAQFEEILVDTNVITTTNTNADLELRANGTSTVNLQENVDVTNNLSAKDISVSNTTITQNVTSDNANIGNLEINDNYIETKSINGNLTLTSLKNITIPSNNTVLGQQLTVNGTSILNSNLSITGDITQIGNTTQTGNTTVLGEFTVGDVYIEDNFITTTNSNSNLELRTNSTGEVLIPNNDVQINKDLTVSTDTDLQSTAITGSLTHTGNRNQTGNTTVLGEFTVGDVYIEDNFITTTSGNLTLSATGDINVDTNDVEIAQDLTVSGATSLQDTTITGTVTQTGNRTQTGNLDIAGEISNGNILIEDNFITTTNSNSDLELRANGAGVILIPNNNIQINNNLTVSTDTDLQDTTITGTVTHVGDTTHTGNITQGGELTVDNVYVEDNFITTTSGNLILESAGTGTINVDSNDVEIAQGLTVSGATSLQGTTITGTLTHVGNRTQTGNLDVAGEISNGNILIEDNFITTTTSNSDLELRANGTGRVIIDPDDPITIENNLSVTGNLFYTGALTINGDVVVGPSTQDGSLTVSENLTISGELDVSGFAQFEEILINNNFITTTSTNADLELRASATGNVVLQEEVEVTNNLNVGATLSTQNANIVDSVTSNTFDSSGITFTANTITQKNTISNLEVKASGTGIVTSKNSVVIDNDLTINGNTNIQNLELAGLTQTGNTVQTGDLTVTGNVTVNDLFVSDASFDFEKYVIGGNLITTKTNEDAILKAAGTGNILLNEGLTIGGNLTANVISSDSVYIDDSVSLEVLEGSTDIQMFDNVITTSLSNSDLELRTNGTGSITFDDLEFNQTTLTTQNNFTFATDNLTASASTTIQLPKGSSAQNPNTQGAIRFDTDTSTFEGYNTSVIGFGGVYSDDKQTAITVNNSDDINIFVGGFTEDSAGQVAQVSGQQIRLHSLQVDDINIDQNVISTNVSNSNLELTPNGTGVITTGNFSISANVITNIEPNANIEIKGTGQQWVVFEGNSAIKFPSGDTASRPSNPVEGMTRHNTDSNELETWIGNQWRTSAGEFASISEAQMEEEAFVQTLIYG